MINAILMCVNPYCSEFKKEFKGEEPYITASRGDGWPGCVVCDSPIMVSRNQNNSEDKK